MRPALICQTYCRRPQAPVRASEEAEILQINDTLESSSTIEAADDARGDDADRWHPDNDPIVVRPSGVRARSITT